MHKLSSKIVPAAKTFLIQKQRDELKFVSVCCRLTPHAVCCGFLCRTLPWFSLVFLNELCMNRFSYSLGVASDLCALLR